MAKATAQVLKPQPLAAEWSRNAALVIGASVFVALCARVTIPLPFTPVPLTLQNFGVLFVGLTLGSRRGFAAMVLYLMEGAVGLPVFNPTGAGGVAQLLGVTGGYLLAYPFVAGLAGWVFERGKKTFVSGVIAGLLAEILLFASGISWLRVFTHSFAQAVRFGLLAFVFAEIIKVMTAAAIASGWQRRSQLQS